MQTTTTTELDKRIQQYAPRKRIKMPYDVSVRAYLHAASYYNPEYREMVYGVIRELMSAGCTLDMSLIKAIEKVDELEDRKLADTIIYDLLVEPFI